MDNPAEWIAQLSSADRELRAAAAAALYDLGCRLAESATRAWRYDAALAELLTGSPTVGVAVQPPRFEAIAAAFSRPRLAEVPADQDAREFELHVGAARLDILTTRATPGSGVAPGAIARFLEKFGEGIQQVELPARDVDRATTLLREQFGLSPIYPRTRAGADGTRVNFFLVTSPGGKKVLIELVESPQAD